MVFLPPGRVADSRRLIEAAAARNQVRCLGWREVPTDCSTVGPRARDTLPVIQQCFFTSAHDGADLELRLFRMRKECEIHAGIYFCSLSSKTAVCKGLLTPRQLPAFYSDLTCPDFKTSFAIFHQRYSTNTQPSWSLAQPFRFVAHNGEINTISANRRWLRARQPELLQSLGLRRQLRLLEEGVSDSASFDNALEVFLRRGYSPAEAMLCMVPPGWESAPNLSSPLGQFLEDHARKQEAWDGPAALIFTDGFTVGAKLDRNGLRPLRYTLTSDGLLMVGSEVGIADLHSKQVVERQRLGPGEILLVNSVTGEFLRPHESLQLSKIRPVSSPDAMEVAPTTTALLQPTPEANKVMAALGWSEDQFRLLFQPLVEQGQEAVWSMGDDTPPASLSSMRRPLWDYCKQRFAQVTNPPIDSLRESHVMSLKVFLGRAALNSPLLDGGQLQILEKQSGTTERIDFTFAAAEGMEGAKAALSRLQNEAQAASTKDTGLILLTDRGVSTQRAALPALLALAAVWKSMVKAGAHDVPLVIE